jgi:hypothetical protein
MIKAKIKIWLIAIIGNIAAWLIINSFIIEITLLQFILIDFIFLIFKFLHKLATRDLRAIAYQIPEQID